MSTEAGAAALHRPVAVVTGGGSGIGAAVAALLLDQGWVVHVLDRAHPAGVDDTHHLADVTDEPDLDRLAEQIGPIDGLVAAAGVNLRPGDGSVWKLERAAWDRTLEINLTGTMLTVRAFQAGIRDGGSIVTLGSTAGVAAVVGQDAYTASKGAVVALTRSWAVDFSRFGIRVNCVCPGPTRTAMLDSIMDDVGSGPKLDLPQQRPAETEEIAAVIGFCLSPSSSYLSGAVIPVDGGTTANAAGMPFPRRRIRP